MEFSRCTRAELAQREIAGRRLSTARAGLSKLNSKRLDVEVDVDLGEPGFSDGKQHPSTSQAASRGQEPLGSLERR